MVARRSRSTRVTRGIKAGSEWHRERHMKSRCSPSNNGKRRTRIVGAGRSVRCGARTTTWTQNPASEKNLTSEKTSSVEAAVSAGRDEASCLLLRCRTFATPRVFLAWNHICDSPVADVRFSLGSTGAGGSSVFIRMHFEPGGPQRANACGLFHSGFVCAPAT